MENMLTYMPGANQSSEKTEYWIEPVQPRGSWVYRAVKRLFDICASLAALVALAVPMMVIAAWIKLDSAGPAFYVQERVGKDGKSFKMYKFRSMYLNAEENGPQWADKVDWRCTRAGRFLRRSRLDELPQFWNILRGDMSLVGPRPEREYFYERFETYIHGFRNRLVVRPGLTGWAQVNGGYELAPEKKILYDMEYIQNQSVKIDVLCILQTVKLVFTHEGAR